MHSLLFNGFLCCVRNAQRWNVVLCRYVCNVYAISCWCDHKWEPDWKSMVQMKFVWMNVSEQTEPSLMPLSVGFMSIYDLQTWILWIPFKRCHLFVECAPFLLPDKTRMLHKGCTFNLTVTWCYSVQPWWNIVAINSGVYPLSFCDNANCCCNSGTNWAFTFKHGDRAGFLFRAIFAIVESRIPGLNINPQKSGLNVMAQRITLDFSFITVNIITLYSMVCREQIVW